MTIFRWETEETLPHSYELSHALAALSDSPAAHAALTRAHNLAATRHRPALARLAASALSQLER